jgi:hypothetical protein
VDFHFGFFGFLLCGLVPVAGNASEIANRVKSLFVFYVIILSARAAWRGDPDKAGFNYKVCNVRQRQPNPIC